METLRASSTDRIDTQPTQPSTEGLSPLAQIEALQAELAAVRTELNFVYRRDETLNFYMHRLDEELRLAARLQQDFLPKSLPQVGQVRFHTLFRPAGYVSGDLYDVARLDEAHVGFYMADAVGHGMPAALLTMFIKNALVTKQISPQGYRLLDPCEALAKLNACLVEQNLTHATFATAFYGMVNTETLMCRYSAAGHPPPLLIRADGSMINCHAHGALLGIFPGEQYLDQQIQLRSGDRMFIYTDGIEVAFADDQVLDTQQWRTELHRRRELPAESLLEQLAASLDKENGSLAPKDDLTIVVLEIT